MNNPHESSDPEPNVRRNWLRVKRPLKGFGIVTLVVIAFLVVFFFNRIFINIEAGHGGVLWKRFLNGTDLKHVYAEGFHVIPPWDKMAIYDLRIQQVAHEFVALSKDGLPITVELSIRYRPMTRELPTLHQEIGPDYVDKVVKPEVQAQVRFVLAQYSPEEIYTSEGFLLQIILQGSLGEIAERHILVDDLLIKRLVLPEVIRAAIEQKLARQQIVQEYEYRIQAEEKEADRKRIEAAGIRDFQTEVMKGGAFDKYLRYFGVSATVELAGSNNAKMVVIGGGSDGLPLILNMTDTPTPAEPMPPEAKTEDQNSPERLERENQPELEAEARDPENLLRSLFNGQKEP